MKNNNLLTFMITSGVFVVVVFTFVAVYNIITVKQSDVHYAKVENLNGKIENITIDKDKLNVILSGNIIKYCVKTTRTVPTNESVCWQDINNKKIETTIYYNKKYYLWIMDNNNNISDYVEIN